MKGSSAEASPSTEENTDLGKCLEERCRAWKLPIRVLPVSPVPPSPHPVQQSWLEQGAQAVSEKQAEEGASKLPGQKQGFWEQEAVCVNHKADTLVGASSFPGKWYFEGLGVWQEAPDCPQMSQAPL